MAKTPASAAVKSTPVCQSSPSARSDGEITKINGTMKATMPSLTASHAVRMGPAPAMLAAAIAAMHPAG